MAKRIRKMFPGGNTSQGFYSYYHYILPDNARRMFILKGGPGTGKSILMRRVAEDLAGAGFDLEFHYCSSDIDSLDGVAVPLLGVAIIDGTAPHMIDPKYPAAVDEIINLGDYWNVEGIEKRRQHVVEYSSEVSRSFKRAYRYLAAAKEVMDDIESCYTAAMDFGRVNMLLDSVRRELFDERPVVPKPGRERHLFGSAYTPAGLIDYTDTVLDNVDKVFYIDGYPGTGKTAFMNRLAKLALERGFSIEFFHTPLKPWKVDTIVIEGVGAAVTCSGSGKRLSTKVLEFNKLCSKRALGDAERFLNKDFETYETLIAEAVESIAEAHRLHDKLEACYIPNMDFGRVNGLKDSIVKRIIGLAQV